MAVYGLPLASTRNCITIDLILRLLNKVPCRARAACVGLSQLIVYRSRSVFETPANSSFALAMSPNGPLAFGGTFSGDFAHFPLYGRTYALPSAAMTSNDSCRLPSRYEA